MTNMATFNLTSPNGILAPCDTSNLNAWLENEIAAIVPEPVQTVVRTVCAKLGDFIQWPKEALLLWHGCDRVAPPGKQQRIHRYPSELKAASGGFKDWDTRPNGPAIAAFILAGGTRPNRFGSTNAWSIHHLYSGKFPYQTDVETTHATKKGLHFTQSAGLVAVHPIADTLCDEFPFFTWLLRAEAFKRFGYDPDGVFSENRDEFGFLRGHSCRVIHTPPAV